MALSAKPPPRTAESQHNPDFFFCCALSLPGLRVTQESPSLLAVMVTVFDAAFGPEGAVNPASACRKVLPVSGTAGEGLGERSLDSLADLAHLLVSKTQTSACGSLCLHRDRFDCRCCSNPTQAFLRTTRPPPLLLSLQRHAEPPRSRPSQPPARLNRWARSCILRGIRPVPDALPLGDGDGGDSNRQGTGRRSRRTSERRGGSVSFKAEPSTPAVPSPRALPVGSGGDDRTPSAALSRRASASPPKTSAATELPPAEAAPGQEGAGPDKSGDAAKGGGGAVLEAGDNVSTPVAVVTEVNPEDTTSFASFPAPAAPGPSDKDSAAEVVAAPTSSDEDEFVWSEATPAMTPEMPRHPPPRVPLTPPAADGANRNSLGADANESGNNDGAVNAGAPTGLGAVAKVDAQDGSGGGGDDDDGDWSDDPFDSFQSAPPASPPAPPLAPPPPPPRVQETSPFAVTAAPPATAITAAAANRASSPSPPVETSPWNLDFLMAAPAKGGGAEGRLSPAPGAASVEGDSSGKSLDLVR